MSDDERTISSEAEFTEKIHQLLKEAHRGGVDVEGAYECRNGSAYADWDIVITVMSKPEKSD